MDQTPSQLPATRRRGLWLAAAGTAAVALLVGGVIGGLIGYGNGHRDNGAQTTAAPPPATVTAPAPVQVNPAIPTTADPVCAQWAPLLDSYNAKDEAWTKTDPNIPADQWSPDRRAANMAIVPVMKAEAAII